MKLCGGPVGAGEENQKVYNGYHVVKVCGWPVGAGKENNWMSNCLRFTNGQYDICICELFSINHSISASV